MEGRSLSFCIRDIIRGEVDPDTVSKIVCSCRPNEDDSSRFDPNSWEKILDSYENIYWWEAPEQARALADRFLSEGKIDFPRLRGEAMPFIAFGHWVDG